MQGNFSEILFRNDVLPGCSLVVQWLGLGMFTIGAQVQSWVREPRSGKPHAVVKKIITITISFL